MSGWSVITVEPGSSTEEQLPSAEALEELIDHATTAKQAHETGSIDYLQSHLSKLSEKAGKLVEETGEVDAEAYVNDYLRERWSEEASDSYGVLPRDPPTFQHGIRGLAPNGGVNDVVDEIFTDCPHAERILVICANDTSDSGSGWLYQRTNGGWELVDQEDGYEGARGRDVTGFFRDEYNIHGRANPY